MFMSSSVVAPEIVGDWLVCAKSIFKLGAS